MEEAEYLEGAEFTEEHTDNYRISWTIPNFKKLIIRDRQFCSHKNSMVKTTNSKFYLKISVNGLNIDVYFLSATSIFLKYTLELAMVKLRATHSNTLISPKVVNYHTVQGNKWQHCMNFNMATSFGFNPYRSTYSLRIVVNFQVSQETKNKILTPQLSNDFENLLTDGSYSDVTMKSSEGVEFKVHKNIICIRSKVLKAHFEHNTSESITNLVETAWETEVLREVLTFVYTDKCPRIEEFPEKLMAAADYYQLERLKCICEEELTKRLTVENAIDTLQLAELYSLDNLIKHTLDFIKCGRTKLVIETQGWKNIQSAERLKRIYEFIMSNEIDNSDILASALKEISPDLNK